MPLDNDEPDSPPPAPQKVFISRVDTYFGRILAQHLGRSIPGETSLDGEPEERDNPLDHSFLYHASREGAFQVTGSWRVPTTDESDEGIEPVMKPHVPALQSLILSANEAAVGKALDESDICILNIVDYDGSNSVLEDTRTVLSLLTPSSTPPSQKKNKPKTLILISTTMVWGKTRRPGQEDATEEPEASPPTDNEEEDEEVEGFHEEDYKKRRPHPDYRKYLEMEKDFLKIGRDSKGLLLTTTVVATGLIYGYGENVLHWIFKEAWEGSGKKKLVTIPGNGKNHVPMIHARDLCQVIQNVCDKPPKSRYIFAVDDGKDSLSKICQSISKTLSFGETESYSPEDLLQMRKVTKTPLDLLTTDLRVTPATVKDAMKIQWVSKKGLSDSAAMVIQEFRIVRNLTPIKLAVLGPPFSGKTDIAKKLAEFYKIFYLNVNDVVHEAMDVLYEVIDQANIDAAKKAILTEEDEPEENEEEGPSKSEIAQDLVNRIEEGRLNNKGQMEDQYIIQFVRERLLSAPCQNQGFVLDNFPDNHVRAAELFGAPGEGEENMEETGGDTAINYDRKIIPDFVIFLDASEDILRQRMMLQADPGISTTTDNTTVEQKFNRRMKDYKLAQENEESTAMYYFDETDTPTITLPVVKDVENCTETCLKTAITRIGPPHNYGLTIEQKRSILGQKEMIRLEKQQEKKQIQEIKKAEEAKIRQKHCIEWSAQMDEVQREKYERVLSGTPPIRDYLEKNVLPAVQRGLLAMVQCKPADPVDYLGEYLLQLSNPLKQRAGLTVDEQLTAVARQ